MALVVGHGTAALTLPPYVQVCSLLDMISGATLGSMMGALSSWMTVRMISAARLCHSTQSRRANEPYRNLHDAVLVGVVAVMPWRLIAAGVILAGITAWHLSAVHAARNEGRAEVQAILDAERIAARQAVASQAEANRLAAESAQEQAGKREAALQTRLKGMRRELWTATENLATCRLSGDAIGMLNRARTAGEDQPATSRTK